MAKYTLELYTLLQDENFKLFDFNYDFYETTLKENFEAKFIDNYLFDEIGFETVKRFKHNLKNRLNLIMPYYLQLYKTQLEAENINFLLNKDLKETFVRDIIGNEEESLTTNYTGTNNSTSSNEYTGTNTNSSSTEANSDSNSKESYLDNGNADLSLTDGLTGVSSNDSTGSTTSSSSTSDSNTTNSTSNTTDTNSSTSNKTNGNTMQEKTELISQGNIGITSSAELLEKWRNTIINIDKMIIDDCKDLFMQIY